MNCNNTITFIKEWNRMCNNYDSECSYCPLEECKMDVEDCMSWVCHEKNIELAIEIVHEWSKENPPKTYLSVFKEKYPKAPLNGFGLPSLCVNDLYENVFKCSENVVCKECWNTHIED